MTTISYFVDEAGDTTLFGRHGKVLIGTEAVSRFFIVGRLEVDDADALEADITAPRAELLADPAAAGRAVDEGERWQNRFVFSRQR